MPKFQVVLERTDTITKQAEMMVEAPSPDEARQTILADLEVDPGSYDDDLEPVSQSAGDMKVSTARAESPHDPTQFPWPVANRA
ncbi:MAG TPA: hypothetical protein VIB38_09955 [Aestuariivirgaceae bacterium]|jgi:hypothetical protein